MEIWKDVKGFEGKYQISNEGRVKSIKTFFNYGVHTTELFLKERIMPNGYVQYCLTLNGIHYYFYAHRLVAEAFIENPDNKPEIDHINGIRDDNKVENLQWVTKSENMCNPLTTEKISESKKGKRISPETEFKKGQTPWNKGKPHSEETKRKISEAKKKKEEK